MATENVKIVDPDNGTGTDYTSLSAWEAGEEKDLQQADEIAVAKCRCSSGSADTDPITIDGSWNPDATRYIKIWTDPSENYRHDGKWNDSKYRLVATATHLLRIYEAYTRIEGLQVYNTNTSTLAKDGIKVTPSNNSDEVTISHCIIRGNNPTGDAYGRGIYESQATLKAYNNIIYDWGQGTTEARGIYFYGVSTNAYIYNNTIHNCYYGLNRRHGTVVAKNNITQDCTDGFYGDFDGSSDYNVSDISGDAPGANSKTCTVSFVDEANDDFHLASSDTCAKDAGVDLSSDPNLAFNDDIDGETRSGSWDIGADEYVAAGGQVFSVTLQDSLSLSDSRGAMQDKVMAESLALSDRKRKELEKCFLASLSISDRKRKELEKHFLDSLSLSDTHFKSCLFHRLFTDLVTITDTAVKTLDKSLQDQLDISDKLVKTLSKIFTTSITLTDTFIAEIISGVVEKVFQDTLLLSDLKKIDLDKKITDMLLLSDMKRTDLDKRVADTLSLSDARRIDLDKRVRDILSLSDIKKLDLDKKLADTLPLSDTYIAQITGILTKVLVDSLILTDRSKKELFKSFFDTLPVEDTIKAQVIFTKLLTDTLLQLQDRRKKEIEKTIAESVALNDKFTKEELKILTDTLIQLSDNLNAQIVWAVVKVITAMFTDIKDPYGMKKDIKDPYGMKGS